MRHYLIPGVCALVALQLGCSGSTPATPTPTSTTPLEVSPQVAAALASHALLETTVGRFSFAIDPDALTATATPIAMRSIQANDDVYDLSIANFTKRDTIAVRAVERTATTLDITYDITHPFAAPTNLAGPATAANRADLGVAGRLLFLFDVPSAIGNTYLTGIADAVANTSTVANADGYFQPEGLLPGLTQTADTFPYLSLVDESGADGSRNGISNAGNPTGNYNPADGGWQQTNIGFDNNGWTGFGVLHQGQSSRRTLSINLSALSGPLSIETVILAKYNDPRQGLNAASKRANRLPKNPPDPSQFAYRMPHGAIDVESIVDYGESGGFIPNAISASTLHFGVVDWDARAAETIEADLSGDPLVGNVAVGESGAPTLYVNIPAIQGTAFETLDPATDLLDDDSAFGGDAGLDLGIPGDRLYYTRTITNSGSGQVPGPTTGMLYAEDVENGIDTSGWAFALAPDLTPATSPPANGNYQAFTVTLAPLSAPPVATFTMATPNVVSGGSCTIQASGYSDPELDTIDVRIDWNNDGDFGDPGETGLTLPGVGGPPVNFTAPITYTYGGGTDTRQVPVDYTDGGSPPIVVTPVLTFNVVPPGLCGAPFSAVTPFTAGWSNSPASNFFNFEISTSATGANLAYAAYRTPTLNVPAANTHAGYLFQQRVTSPSLTNHIYRVYCNGPLISSGVTIVPLTNAPTTFGSDVATTRQVHTMDVDTTGRILFATTVPGVHTNNLGSGMAHVYTNGESIVRYFESDGGSTVVLDADISSFATPNPVIALAVDQVNDLYTIDTMHVMRKWSRASGYSQVMTAPFPLNLASAGIGIDLTQRISDFDFNFHNQAIFVLSETTGAEERIYRIECDGTLQNPVPGGGGANPLATQVSGFGAAQAYMLELVIDNYDTSGNLLPDAADVQMLGFGFNGTSGHEVHFFTSQLARTGGQEWAIGTFHGTIDVQRNWIMSRQGSLIENHYVRSLPPVGWQ